MKIQSFWNCQNGNCEGSKCSKNDFTQNLSDTKIHKFPHSAYATAIFAISDVLNFNFAECMQNVGENSETLTVKCYMYFWRSKIDQNWFHEKSVWQNIS